MKRKITKVLAILMALTMMVSMLPVTALAANTYSLTVSITDSGTGSTGQVVSDKAEFLNGDESLVATIATLVSTHMMESSETNDRPKLKDFQSPAMQAKLQEGIVKAANQGDWDSFVTSTMSGATGTLKTYIESLGTKVIALTPNTEYSISYTNAASGDAKEGVTYTITAKLEVTSGGNAGGGGGSGSGSSGGGTAAPTDPEPAAPGEGENPDISDFTDVSEEHVFYDEIAWAVEEGLLKGVTETTYNPADSISRQQLWTVLGRLDGVDPTDMAAAKAWAVELGISDGSAPGAAVTRQQMVTIIYRYAQMKGYDTSSKADLSAFPDAGNVSDYAADAMAWAVANGIVNGTLEGTLNPAGNTTRGQFAAILYRFADKFV